jgi:type V secretory pathway adhesin AidA
MPILKQATSPTGTNLVYHEVHKLETSQDFLNALVYVRGYASEPNSDTSQIVAWMWQFTVPAGVVTSLLPTAIETLLVSEPNSPLFGGEILQAETELETAKRKKWMEIKRERELFEFGSFTWNSNVFDADALSQQRVGQAAQQAMLFKSLNTPFSQSWTLKDNTDITLNGDQMIEVALAMGQHINLAHDRSRELRALLDAATTTEEVDLLHW